MAIERSQSREEQDKQLDQISRDASPNKNRVRDHCLLQYQRYDLYQQEVQQQKSKGKEVLVEEKDPLNGVAIGEDGQPIERQIILSDHYDENNPGLAGGAGDAEELSKIAQSIGNNLEAMLNAADAVIDTADKLAMDPASKLVVGILKAAMQKRRDDKLDNALVTISGKLDDLILRHYRAASIHLKHANSIMEEESRESGEKRRKALAKLRQTQLDFATKSFTDSISLVKDACILIGSKFYAGVCFSLQDVSSCAMDYYNQVYNEGHELWNKYIKELNKLEDPWHLSFNKDKKREDIVDKLVYLYQYMEPVKRIVENSPSTSDNVASTSNNAGGDRRSLNTASIDTINNFYKYHLNISGQHKPRETKTLSDVTDRLGRNRKNMYTL
jgi:hypothetical protein